MRTIKIDDEVYKTLEILSTENGIDIDTFIGYMATKMDKQRHIVWNRQTRSFRRVKCGSSKCLEVNERNSDDAE